MTALHIGIDFGYQHTGICLLDDENRVLDIAKIEHRTDLSKKLAERRANRSMRRRGRSKRRRLRDFHKLLCEMGCPPAQIEKGDRDAERKKDLPANRLYALVHRRGWDYADLVDLLLISETDKSPQQTQVVKQVDQFLIAAGAPATPKKPPQKPGKKETPAQFQKRLQKFTQAAEKHRAGELTENDARYMEIQESCLGELARLATEEYKLAKKLEKKPGDEDLNDEWLVAQEAFNELECRLRDGDQDGNRDDIKNWLDERLTQTFEDKPPPNKKELLNKVMARLGLLDSVQLFEDGKTFRPVRNRHRDIMLKDMDDLFDEIAATSAAPDAMEQWKQDAREIVNKQYRKKRFENRKVGKCPAQNEDGQRCNKNVPKRSRVDVRQMFFEAEARQMNVTVEGEVRKLTEDEILALLDCVEEWKADGGKINVQKWDAFFKTHKPQTKTEDGETLRNKRDVLRDLVCGKQGGRARFCARHIGRRLALLKQDGGTTSEEWARLHDRQAMDESDASPSLRQKIQQVCSVVLGMIKRADARGQAIAHIGIESARFDIHKLAAAEGRKFKKSAYSKKRGTGLAALRRAQGDLCMYCGKTLAGDATVDHVFPQARGGGDKFLNRVAACQLCNLDKGHGLGASRLNAAALAALRASNKKKAAYIQNRLDADNRLPPDNLAAPVQTMFGAKVLRGALTKALNINEQDADNIFTKIRASDVVRLREAWYPFMHRQKAALRAGDSHPVGKTFTLDREALKKLGVLSLTGASFIKSPAPECALGGTLRVENGGIKMNPGDEDVGKWLLRVEGECEREYSLEEGEEEKIVRLGRNLGASIKQDSIKGLVAEIETNDNGWQTLTMSPKGDAKTRKLTVTSAALCLPIVISPRKNDLIHDFHHIVDAAVLAANVDWRTILRLARQEQERNRHQREAFGAAARANRPDLSGFALPYGDGDFRAPEKKGDWMIEDRGEKSGARTAKTKREPVRYRGAVATQRVPLDKLKRKEIERIYDKEHGAKKIYRALREAWREIDALTDDERGQYVDGSGKDRCITAAWFLQLPKDHFLYPARTETKGMGTPPRSVRVCLYQQNRKLFALRRGRHTHYFEREDFWGSVVVFQANGQRVALRRYPSWYINAANPDAYEDDAQPPPGAEQIAVFKRGDLVQVDNAELGLHGRWRLKSLQKQERGAELEADDDAAREAGHASSQATTFDNHGYVCVKYPDLRHVRNGE